MSDEMTTPPNNVEAERAVLGSILLDTTGRDDRVMDICLSSGIVPESFYDPRNREIYTHMLEIARLSEPLDALTLIEKLRIKNRLEAVGGVGYVQSLVDQTPTTAHAEYYVNLVVSKHLRRKMIDRANTTIKQCYDESEFPDAMAVLGTAEKSFLEIGSVSSSALPWSQAVQNSFERIDAMFNSDGHYDGLSTGLKYLDEKIQGLKNSEMIVIAARPSVGKTSLAMNIAECVALGEGLDGMPCANDGGKRHPVMIFSLEMPIEALTKRMVAGRARLSHWKLNRGLVSGNDRKSLVDRLYKASGDLKSAPIFVDDTASLDIVDLRARARRAKKQYGIELVVIDYLQLCHCSEGARQNRQIEVSMISQQIKAMAKELRIPVIVLSQLSRANEQRGDPNEKPKLSDLRDSGAIEQDADMVFLLRRPSFIKNDKAKNADDTTLAIIDVAKNRNGETGEISVSFYREFTRFEDRDPRENGRENFQSSEPPPEQAEFSEGSYT